MGFEVPKHSRKPSCTLCSNHGIRSELKGHKYHCKFSDCECQRCDRGRVRREVMRKQVKLRRHQMKVYSAKSTDKVRDHKVESPPPRMIQSMNFEPRPPAPMCNVSPSFPSFVSRFPPQGIPYTQSNPQSMAAAYFVSMPPSGLSPRNGHSPLHRLSPVRRLSVSDNSAFVRFSPQSNTIRGVIGNPWPACEVGDPKEAAITLASLPNMTLRFK